MDGSIDLCISYIFSFLTPGPMLQFILMINNLSFSAFVIQVMTDLKGAHSLYLIKEKVKGGTIAVQKYLLRKRNMINGVFFNLRKKKQGMETRAT